MDCLKRFAMFDAQPGERVDVEKTPIVDLVAGEPPISQPIMLTLEQMMQREDRRRSLGEGPISVKAALDHIGCTDDCGQLGLELRRGLARRVMRSAISVGNRKKLPAGRRLACAGLD